MARSEARVFASIWKDEDFLALPPMAQRMYMFLLSQEDLTHCGVIPLRLPRWARKSAGLTVAQLEADLELLAAGPRPFIVTDEDTGELLVRSLIRHDGVWKQPNIMKSARESAALIESRIIRAVLLNELLRIPAQDSESVHVRTVHAAFVADLRKGTGNPSPNPSPDPAGNGSTDPPVNPSQGKGEGNGPVLEDSPLPDPRRAAAAPARQRTQDPNPSPPPQDPIISELRERLDAARLTVRWDKLKPDQLTEILALAARHGPARLVQAASREYQPSKPPAFAQAWLPGWRALPPPGQNLHALARNCPVHLLEEPCRSCAADRLAGEAAS